MIAQGHKLKIHLLESFADDSNEDVDHDKSHRDGEEEE